MRLSKLGLILAGVYYTLVVFTYGVMVYTIATDPAESALSGVPLILVTLPWSWLAHPLAMALPDVAWIRGLPDLVGGLINAAIWYAVGVGLETVLKRRS